MWIKLCVVKYHVLFYKVNKSYNYYHLTIFVRTSTLLTNRTVPSSHLPLPVCLHFCRRLQIKRLDFFARILNNKVLHSFFTRLFVIQILKKGFYVVTCLKRSHMLKQILHIFELRPKCFRQVFLTLYYRARTHERKVYLSVASKHRWPNNTIYNIIELIF